jgi:hypothetical protein
MIKISGIGDFTKYTNSKLSQELTSTSYTYTKPIGKDRSMNVMSSQKVSQMGQDFDSRSYIGGGIQYKTYTALDTVAKVILGNVGLVKDIQVSGTFREVGELEIIANNF